MVNIAKGTGQGHKFEVFLSCENVFRTLSNSPKIMKVRELFVNCYS